MPLVEHSLNQEWCILNQVAILQNNGRGWMGEGGRVSTTFKHAVQLLPDPLRSLSCD